jgi:hypothetical protein
MIVPLDERGGLTGIALFVAAYSRGVTSFFRTRDNPTSRHPATPYLSGRQVRQRT